MDKLVIMLFEGKLVDYLLSVDPEKYGPFVHVGRDGKKRIYVELLKALYGCIRSALLWFNHLSGSLKQIGFTPNAYNPCVMNKVIEGQQCSKERSC